MSPDYVKCDNIPTSQEKIEELSRSLEGFEYKTTFDETTGEVIGGFGEYRQCEIVVKSGEVGKWYVNFKGSLHKYYNHPNMNNTDFTYNQIVWVINNLCHVFGGSPNQWRIKFLEFGVNLNIDPEPIIRGLIMGKKNPFYKDINEGKNLTISKTTQYDLKAYDKGKHVLSKGGKQSNKSKIFRWECRYRVMERLNEKGIHSLDDLMNKDKLNSLKDILLSKWDEAIIFDREAIDLTSIPEVDKMKLLEGLNDDYWKGNTHTIKSRKRRYKELNVKYAGRDLIRIIHEMIFDKCDMLLNNEAEIYFIEEQESNLNFTGSDHLLNFTGSDRVNQKSFTLPIHQNIATKQHSVKNTNFTVSDHLYKPSETVNLSKQELKELAFKLIGEYSSISDTSLLNEIKEQTNCSNERDIGNDMYRKGIIKKTIPFENRFHLSWSTPF